ncbi:FIST signal transduction protein [Ensifer soli]|uniref:FIST signal transduction protein n=1 Tax=Ciceribacter sp. sgz301302 TaxID=3342379 RepID=UPI0035B860EB
MPVEDQFVARAVAGAREPDAVTRLSAGLGPGPFALVVLFLSPDADLGAIVAAAARQLPASRLVGCTTAGEIAGKGYDEGCIVAIGFPDRHFAAETVLVPDLTHIVPRALSNDLLNVRQRLTRDHAHLPEEFALLLVDGLSAKEDELTSALAAGTGAMPIVGGSAGDGVRFRETFVIEGTRILRNAAVVAVVRSACAVRVFNMDHLVPTARRLVVTEADPAARIVRRINAEPALNEIGRVLGMDPADLDAGTFASHPLAVQMGERHHVRAIQRILPSGELLFFSAIDEGVVLTLAEPRDLVAHLARELDRLYDRVPPAAILAFDCILRRLEAQEKQMTGRVSDLLRRHGVVGFSTYGEQIGPMHVNHTMTGLAFYPPGSPVAEREP